MRLGLLLPVGLLFALPCQSAVLRAFPEWGGVIYSDAVGEKTARMALGGLIALDFPSPSSGDWSWGAQIGALFSKLGAPGSNFFGADPDLYFYGQDAKLWIIPILGTLSYQGEEGFRIEGHLGIVPVHLSESSAISWGEGSFAPESEWKLLPSIGLAVGWSRESIGPELRFDTYLASESSIHTVTLGLSIPIL